MPPKLAARQPLPHVALRVHDHADGLGNSSGRRRTLNSSETAPAGPHRWSARKRRMYARADRSASLGLGTESDDVHV